jgi:O-antigen ligase
MKGKRTDGDSGIIHNRSLTTMSASIQRKESMLPFYLIVLFLFFEYGRPQYLFPPLRFLHLPGIIIGSLALLLFLSGKYDFKDKQTVILLLLIFEMMIHGPIALNNQKAYEKFYGMTINLFAYVAIVNFVDKDYKYDKLIKFYILTFIFLGIMGILNKGIGIGGFLGDENDLCMALNTILPFGLFGIFSAKSQKHKIYFLIITCIFLASILSYSRGGFIGLVSVIIYSWIRTNKKLIFMALIGVLVVFAIIVAPAHYWERVATISSEYKENTESSEQYSRGTGGQRKYAWRLGWHIFLQNPIIGVGQGNYPWHVGKTEEALGVDWQGRSLAGREAHSLYFTLLPELGLIGTFLFGAMLYYSIINLFYIRNISKENNGLYSNEESKKIFYLALALEGSLIAFLISSIFVSTLYYPNFWVLCAFIASLRKIIFVKCNNLNSLKQNLNSINA